MTLDVSELPPTRPRLTEDATVDRAVRLVDTLAAGPLAAEVLVRTFVVDLDLLAARRRAA